MARMSNTFQIGDRVQVEVGKKMVAGRVEHTSFDRTGKNQILVRTKKCFSHRRREAEEESCPNCPTYYDEDDVNKSVALV